MKKKLTILLFLILGIITSTYAQKSFFYKAKNYRGDVFDSTFFLLKSVANQKSRANLSLKDIQIAESILKEKLKNLNCSKVNQVGDCPDIVKKLNKYHRQYFGFINSRGEKIVWINLFWDKALNAESKYNLITMNDGCSYYWNIEVNLSTQTISNLNINGKS